MLATLKAMVKEEWRMHSLLFGNKNFSFFPVIVAVLAFIASMLLPIYRILLTSYEMTLIVHLIYLFFGLSVGGFGFMGQEALNRRLGDISLIAYASRTLPLSERRIFANFVAKDTLFYALFLIAPFLVAYAPARLILGLTLASLPYLAISLTLTFLLGLGISFMASTAYAHWGKKALAAVFLAVFAYTLYDPQWFRAESLSTLLPPLGYYLRHDAYSAILSIALVAAMPAVSLGFLKVDYRLAAKRYHNQYHGLVRRLSMGEYSPLVAKDLLDLNRSEGGLGKIVMSYGFPLAAVAAMVSFFSNLLPIGAHHFMLLIAVMTGLISTSLYSWLTELDFAELYAFMPVPTSYLIKSKLALYATITAAVGSATLAVAFAIIKPPPIFLPAAFLLTASVAAYTTAVTVYLTGLKPNSMLYSGKVFIVYLVSILPPMIVPAVVFMTGLATPLMSLLLTVVYGVWMLPTASFLLRKSFVKWDAVEKAAA